MKPLELSYIYHVPSDTAPDQWHTPQLYRAHQATSLALFTAHDDVSLGLTLPSFFP